MLRDREVTSGGKKKNSWTKTVDNTTNLASEINIGGDLETYSGAATSIIGSQVDVTGNLTADVGTNLIIANAVNSSLIQSESTKRGSVKTVKSVSSDYVETALASNVNADNIALNVGTSGSGGTLLIQGSKMDSTTNTTTNAKNTIITDAILQESHYSHKATSSRGIARVGTAITSTVMGIVGGVIHLVGNIIKPLDDGAVRSWNDNQFMDNQFANIKHKTFETKTSTHSKASDVTAGNNLTITSAASGGSGGDTTIQASNVSATNQLTLNAENLNILTRSETNVNTSEDKVTRALSFTNYNEGSINTSKIIDSTLNANSIVYNVTGKANVEVSDKADQTSLPYLIALKNQTNPESLVIASKSDFSKEWNDANRGLTGAGTAVVAIAAVAATIVTAGALAPVTAAAVAAGTVSYATAAFVVTTAVAGTALSNASVSATNSSMNAEGGIGKQVKTVSKDSYKATTSDEALKSYAIAGGTALLTMGLMQGANYASNGSLMAGNATNATISQQITTALAESTINTVASTAVQSVVTGDSFADSLKRQGLNIVISAVGNLGAKQIGMAYHPADGSQGISKATQLALHAGLGCGMAAAGGNDCASGAVSGMVGEEVGSYAYNNLGYNRQTAIQLGGLAGGASAIITGNAVGLDDQQIADNVFSGQRIGDNAAANNATYVDKNGKVVKVDKEDGDRGVYINNDDGGTKKDIFVGNSKRIDTFINPETGKVMKGAKIYIGTSMDSFVENVSNVGGATAGGTDYLEDLYYLAKDSSTGGPFDVKNQLGAFNGYLLNGEYVTGRDIGNYLAGVNGTKAGMPETATMVAAGALQTYKSFKAGDYVNVLLAPISPYYGEAPYSGIMIQEGIRNTQNPPIKNNAPLASIPTSEYFNNINNLFIKEQYSLPSNQ